MLYRKKNEKSLDERVNDFFGRNAQQSELPSGLSPSKQKSSPGESGDDLNSHLYALQLRDADSPRNSFLLSQK